jgi:succinyl-diaminopimelate desuccinylase
VLTAGEENGCEGARFLAERGLLPERMGALVVGEPTANRPLVGHKGVLWLEIEFAGRTAHGSAPELGDNAVYKAARMIRRLESWTFAAKPHPVLGPPTLNVGMLHGGLNINSVPDRAVISLDIRTVPGVNHDAVREAVSGCSDAPVRMRTLADMASVASDPADEWMRQVFAVVSEKTGAQPEPRSAAYFTDAAALRSAGKAPPTVILGPGEPSLAHQTDEFVRLPHIETAEAIYTDIIRAW